MERKNRRPLSAIVIQIINILVKTNLIREHVKTERVKLEFVPSTDQLVEIFTKPLKEPDF